MPHKVACAAATVLSSAIANSALISKIYRLQNSLVQYWLLSPTPWKKKRLKFIGNLI